MIKEIDKGGVERIAPFLAQGFPESTLEFWNKGLASIINAECHKNGDHPIGYTLVSKGEIVGIGLTPTCLKKCAVSGQMKKYVNLSSWYVAKAHRWKMPVLLRAMLADKEAIYTDLTPAPDMQIVLNQFGFDSLNDGVSVALTALYALIGSRRLHAKKWERGRDYGLPQDQVDLLEDHAELGCQVFIIEKDGKNHAIIFKIGKVKGVTVAHIIYAPQRDLIEDALASLSAKLMLLGCLAIFIDYPVKIPENARVSGLWFPSKYRKMIKNETDKVDAGESIDIAYSEVVYFN